MKARRMLLMVLIAAAMVFTAMLNVAYADEDWQDVPENTDEVEEIEINEPEEVEISTEGETVTFQFTPEEDGVYEFFSSENEGSSSELDTEGRVMVQDGADYKEIAYNDDVMESSHFRLWFQAKAGKTYFLQAKMLGEPSKAVSFQVRLMDTDISGIEYRPENQQFKYLMDGYYREEREGVYFVYSMYRKMPAAGDELEIKYKDGESAVYVFDEEDYCYKCEGYEPIEEWKIDFKGVDNRDWSVGAHKAVAIYNGCEMEFDVEVVENDIKAIEYKREEPVVYYENDIEYGYWDGKGENEFFHYTRPYAELGDKLRITYKDDSVREFTCKTRYEDEEYHSFIAEDGTYFSTTNVFFSDDQKTKHWGVDENIDDDPEGNNYYMVSYGGASVKMPVTINASPIAAISFEPANPYQMIENDERFGWEDSDYDDDEILHDYFHYDTPGFSDDDTLTVTPLSGSDKIYKYKKIEIEQGEETVTRYYFVNMNDPEDTIDPDDIYVESRQGVRKGQAIWTVGTDNHFFMSYKGRACEVGVEIIENPIKALELNPVSPYKILEGTKGYESYDNDDELFWRYSIPDLNDGDELVMKMRDETQSDIVYVYDSGKGAFINSVDSEDVISRYDPSYISYQSESHWLPGKENFFYVKYRGLIAEVPVIIEENPIKSISFTVTENYKPVEGDTRYGHTNNEGTENEWIYYNVPFTMEGNVLTLYTTEEPEGIDYTCEYDDETSRWYFVNGEDKISADDLEYRESQWSEHWHAGDDNKFTVTYGKWKCEATVTILPNPVKSISYVPVESYKFVENDERHGWISDAGFIYSVEWPREGDVLTLHTIDDKSVDYTCTVNEYGNLVFVNEENVIYPSDITRNDNQFYNNWTVDKDNSFRLRYGGRFVDVPVEIVENPLTSISFTPVNDFVLIEGDPAYGRIIDWDPDNLWFYYDVNIYEEGHTLTIHTVDGEDKEYSSRYIDGEGWFFVNGEDRIDFNDLSFSYDVDQSNNHWTVGSTHYLIVSYLGHTDRASIEIIENPIKKIQFKPAEDYSFIQEDLGSGFYEQDDNGVKWFHYYEPYFVNGDVLTLTIDDNDVDYTYSSDEDAFINTDGDMIHGNDISRDFNQYDKHWTLGSENYGTISYRGFECSVKITITESPIDSIEYTRIEPDEFLEKDESRGVFIDSENGDQWFYYNINGNGYEGDILTVHIGDETDSYKYRYVDETDWAFVNTEDENDIIPYTDVVFYSNYQYEKHWTTGSNNFYHISYKGRKCEVPVTIKENPVTAISYEPNKPYVYDENDIDHGRMEWVGSDDEFFYYDLPFIAEGDKITVTKGEDNTVYTYKEVEGTWGFFNDNVMLDTAGLFFRDYQYQEHWTPYNDNYMTVFCLGRSCKVPVSINKSEATLRREAVEVAEALLQAAVGINENDYTEDTYGPFAVAKKALEDEIARETSTSNEIKTATKVFSDAVAQLKTKEEEAAEQEAKAKEQAIKDAGNAKTDADALDGDLYTADTYKAVTDAEEALDAVLAKADATSAEINAAVKNLTDAIAALKTKEQEAAEQEAKAKEQAIKDAGDAKTDADALDGDLYTADTYKAVTDAEETLDAVLAKADATSAEINAAVKDLTDAIAGLKTKEQEAAEQEAAAKETAKQDADTAIKKANAIKADDYTEDSYKAVADAKAALETVLKNDKATSTGINNATKALNDAIAGLKTKAQEAAEIEAAAKETAKQDADKAVKSAAALKAEDYTDDTYKAVADAKAALETVLKNDKATSTDINNATKALNDAIAGLKTKADAEKEEAEKKEAAAKETAKQDADKAIKGAAAVKAEDYTDDTYKAVADAKAALETVLKNDKATSTDINNAVKALTDAMAGLKTKAEAEKEEAEKQEAAAKAQAKADADAAIAEINALDPAGFTEESYSAVLDAMAALEAVLKDEKATSVQINDAIKALRAAKEALKAKEEPAFEKLDNTMKVTAKKVTVKFKSLRKKNQTVKKKSAFTVKKPAGKVTFKLYKKDKKAKNKITINKKGNITVKKGLKKGKYTIKVKVTAAGNDTYKKLTKQVKVKITVK